MRRLLALLLFVSPVALATGFGGSDAPSRIPVPARVFSATVQDIAGTTVDVTRVTFDGEVFLHGRVGEGLAAVPFEKITSIRVEPTGDAGKRIAFASLVDGSSVRVVVASDLPCYGESSWGNYRIEAEKIRMVTFHHEAAPAPKP